MSDPIVVVAFISGVVGIVTGLLTLRATKVTEETKRAQVKNTKEIDSVQLRLDHWTELVESLRSEIERKDRDLELKDAKIDALYQTIEHLRGDRDDDTRRE